jgi:hypothetical protein
VGEEGKGRKPVAASSVPLLTGMIPIIIIKLIKCQYIKIDKFFR